MLNFSGHFLNWIFHTLVCNFSREILVDGKKNFYAQKYRKGVLVHVRPSNFVNRILLCVALVYNSYFPFQHSHFTKIIGC